MTPKTNAKRYTTTATTTTIETTAAVDTTTATLLSPYTKSLGNNKEKTH